VVDLAERLAALNGWPDRPSTPPTRSMNWNQPLEGIRALAAAILLLVVGTVAPKGALDGASTTAL